MVQHGGPERTAHLASRLSVCSQRGHMTDSIIMLYFWSCQLTFNISITKCIWNFRITIKNGKKKNWGLQLKHSQSKKNSQSTSPKPKRATLFCVTECGPLQWAWNNSGPRHHQSCPPLIYIDSIAEGDTAVYNMTFWYCSFQSQAIRLPNRCMLSPIVMISFTVVSRWFCFYTEVTVWAVWKWLKNRLCGESHDAPRQRGVVRFTT